MADELTVYAVRNTAGEWMRSTGYGGGGKHWVAQVQDAKLYTKLGQARGRVTFWANHAPLKDPPVIVAFRMSLSDATVIDEDDRVAKAKLRKATAEAEQKRRDAQRRLRDAEVAIRNAETEIARIKAAHPGDAT